MNLNFHYTYLGRTQFVQQPVSLIHKQEKHSNRVEKRLRLETLSARITNTRTIISSRSSAIIKYRHTGFKHLSLVCANSVQNRLSFFTQITFQLIFIKLEPFLDQLFTEYLIVYESS
jgi:hypothetical protein